MSPAKDLKNIDTENITACLEKNGLIASRLPVYEHRQGQLDLLELVIRAFNEDALAAAEAGTGVGKSFAYILPSVYWAFTNDERIVISTATINLQQQLYEKDIPFVLNALNIKIKTVLMKGRANYLCLRRLEDSLKEPGFDDSENRELAQIAAWAQAGKSGSRSDLSFMPSDNVWIDICCEADMCARQHCPYYESCFYQIMRKEAAEAQIIVVNHHLLFADLAARYSGAGYENLVVLPPFSRLVVDEAHTIENSATSFYSREFSRPGILRQLGRLYRKQRRRQRGLLIRIEALLPAEKNINKTLAALEKIRTSVQALDLFAVQLCSADGVYRLSSDTDSSIITENLFPLLIDLRKKLLSFAEMTGKLLEKIPENVQENSTIWEIKSIISRFEDIAEICASFTLYQKKQNDVMWIEKKQPLDTGSVKEPYAVFTQTPVEIAENLKESLFEPNKTVVCVSATLTVNNSFDYWAGRCGFNLLPNRTILNGSFPSPFPYTRSVLLASPLDAPLPDEAEFQEFINRAVAELAASSGGSSLLLFTSYRSLQSAWDYAMPHLTSLGIHCFKQGEDDRARLLQAFLDDESSVLFATDSFWEGIDAPGNTLRLVIICRLPFRSPNNPVFEARREALEKKGGNPFMDLSLPEAVMKFKQGFGRLMRRSSDHGAVVVLDRRFIHKQYGIIFQQSLPETKTLYAELSSIVREMENFLFT